MGRYEKSILNGSSNKWYDSICKGQMMIRVVLDGVLEYCNYSCDWKVLLKIKVPSHYPSEDQNEHWFYKLCSRDSKVNNEDIQVKKSCNNNKRRMYGKKDTS